MTLTNKLIIHNFYYNPQTINVILCDEHNCDVTKVANIAVTLQNETTIKINQLDLIDDKPTESGIVGRIYIELAPNNIITDGGSYKVYVNDDEVYSNYQNTTGENTPISLPDSTNPNGTIPESGQIKIELYDSSSSLKETKLIDYTIPDQNEQTSAWSNDLRRLSLKLFGSTYLNLKAS